MNGATREQYPPMEFGFRKGEHFMQRKATGSFCGALTSMVFATAASAQEILPFPATRPDRRRG